MEQNSTPNLNRNEIAKAFGDSSTHAFTVLAILLATYGEDVFNEDAVTIYGMIQEDFGVFLEQSLENRFQAILSAMTTDGFTDDPSVFESIVKAITMGDPDLDGVSGDLDLDEILWAEYQVELARGESNLDYSTPVRFFIRKISQQNKAQKPEEYADITETIQSLKNELIFQLKAVGFDVESLPQF